MKLPQPPLTATLEDIHRSLTDTLNYLAYESENGKKIPEMSQAQIDKLTSLEQKTNMVYNTDTNKANYAFVNGSSINWKEF